MISEKMEQAINDQINAELYSAYLYGSMSAFYTSINLPGFGASAEARTAGTAAL